MATVNSARSNFRDVIAIAEAGTGRLLALSNVEAYVVQPGTDYTVPGNRIAVYGSRNPADLTPIPQPIVTDATGIVNFWSEPGEVDIVFHDRAAPIRISDQRFGWSPISPITKGIPSAAVRDDSALDLAALSAAILRQAVPIGAVIDWYRPAGTVAVPAGFVICDGATTLPSDQHDFGTGAAFTVPDLRDKFIVGANAATADGTAGSFVAGTGVSTAPGIRGAGGANSVKLVASELAAHAHSLTAATFQVRADSGNTGLAALPQYVAGSNGFSGLGTTTPFGWTVNNNTGGDQYHENKPSYYGLLKIMKVRRS